MLGTLDASIEAAINTGGGALVVQVRHVSIDWLLGP